MSITPLSPNASAKGKIKHGSLLNENLCLSRVNSQWKSTNAAFERLPPVPACSVTCLDIITRKRGKMQINIDEKRAIVAASPEIGAWLERAGKSDLATMTEAEWLGFLAHVYGSICAETRKIWENEVPF